MFHADTDIRAIRKQLKMNQTEFWERVGLTQSAGSRYENLRDIPTTVRMLLTLAYGDEAQAGMMFEDLRDWTAEHRKAA